LFLLLFLAALLQHLLNVAKGASSVFAPVPGGFFAAPPQRGKKSFSCFGSTLGGSSAVPLATTPAASPVSALLLVALLWRLLNVQKEAAGYIHPLWMEGWTKGLTG
jgi:hypothetical protein